MIRCCPLGHRPLGAWLPHRYPPGLATSVCCRKPLFGRALTSRVISVWLALGNPHPVSATDPGGLRGEASVRHLGKQVAGRGAGQGRGSGDHSRSGNLLHGFLIIPAPLPQLAPEILPLFTSCLPNLLEWFFLGKAFLHLHKFSHQCSLTSSPCHQTSS